MNPTTEVLQRAKNQVVTSFTKDVIEFGITPANKNLFVISIVNERGGMRFLLDCYFTIKTGRLTRCKTIEKKLIG